MFRRRGRCPKCRRKLQLHFIFERDVSIEDKSGRGYHLCRNKKCPLLTCLGCDLTVHKGTGRAWQPVRFDPESLSL